MKGKHFFLVFVTVFALVLVIIGAKFLVRHNTALPPGVTIAPTLSSLSPSLVQTPPVATVTVTAAPKPVWPTETIRTLNPTASLGCVQDGRSTADWSTFSDVGNNRHLFQGPILGVRTSTGTCFDTIEFEIATLDQPGPGFTLSYVPTLSYDPTGDPMQLFGLGHLQLTIYAPIDVPTWKNYEFRAGSEYGSLRHIKFAGSFEGVTTFGIGVREKLPFLVMYSNESTNGNGKVIVYLAHE